MRPDHEKHMTVFGQGCSCRACCNTVSPAHGGKGGYIVERIVGSCRQRLCFEGTLEICGLPPQLCPPLTLCEVNVSCIEPCPRQDCCPCGCETLRFALVCRVIDSRGCCAQGEAAVTLAADARSCASACGVNVRRGAEAIVARACFCPPCAFDVCLILDLRTVLSRCEAACDAPFCPSCPPACVPPPIYPQPQQIACRHRTCEHS